MNRETFYLQFLQTDAPGVILDEDRPDKPVREHDDQHKCGFCASYFDSQKDLRRHKKDSHPFVLQNNVPRHLPGSR